MMLKQKNIFYTLLLVIAMISGCGGDEKPVVVKTYSIGGTVSGLTGTLVIRNNGADALTITEDGSFVFATELEDKEAYEVTILSLPGGQSCAVFLGSGKIKSDDVTNIQITCS